MSSPAASPHIGTSPSIVLSTVPLTSPPLPLSIPPQPSPIPVSPQPGTPDPTATPPPSSSSFTVPSPPVAPPPLPSSPPPTSEPPPPPTTSSPSPSSPLPSSPPQSPPLLPPPASAPPPHSTVSPPLPSTPPPSIPPASAPPPKAAISPPRLQPQSPPVLSPPPPISPHPPPPTEPTTSTSPPPPPPPLPGLVIPSPAAIVPAPAAATAVTPPPPSLKPGGVIPISVPAASSHPPPPPPPRGGGGIGGKIGPAEGEGSSRVSSGLVVGLFAGVVVLVLLVVVSIFVVLCRKRRRRRTGEFGGGGSMMSYAGSNYVRFEDRNSQIGQWKQSAGPYQVSSASQNFGRGSDGSPPAPHMATMGANKSVDVVQSFGTFSYEELVAATDGFSQSNLLGQGGFGYVYRGNLGNGKQVAVKQLRIGGKQGEREFQAEVEIISQVHHRNLVSLVGYCVAGADRMLVYEFVPNKTLECHLHGSGQPVMEWGTRMKIALGSAKGLAYLHEECNPTIIHRDIKAANILLDFNFEAKVSDFGLAKIFSSKDTTITHITTRVVGTFGYLAPEYASSGKVTDKSDVYSYGILLLELVTGRPAITRPPIGTADNTTDGSLVNWARPLLVQAIDQGILDGLVDPRLQNHYNLAEMRSMVVCAAACVRLSAWRRPRMSQIVRALEGNLSLSHLSSNNMRPGPGSTRFPYETSDSETYQYSEAMKLLRRALTSDGYGGDGRYSGTTSEYGLYPSASSADSQHAKS